MSTDLRKQTAKGLFWSAIDKGGYQVVALVVGIITARLLSPRDFGLLGAIAIFPLLSNLFVDSGFSIALIRREKNTSEEYLAVLLFNIAIAALIYLSLYLLAPFIASFYKMPELVKLSRFLFLVIIINAFGIVQNIVLSRELAFKEIMIANLSSILVAGVVTIWLIFEGYEYWALAWQQVASFAIKVVVLWLYSPLKITHKANFMVIKEVFRFSSVLLLTSFISTVFKNIYSVIIGKYFNAVQLGYYSQANKLQLIPSTVVTSTFNGVSVSVLSKLNNEKERQLTYYRKLIRITAFVIFPIMIGLIGTSYELIEVLLTDKWLPIVPYFQILAFTGLLWPFHVLNQNIIKVIGNVKLNFKTEMFRNVLILLTSFLCIISINAMLIGFAVVGLITYIVDLYFVQNQLQYKMLWQVKDIMPYALISVGMLVVLYVVQMIPVNVYLSLTLQVAFGGVFYIIAVKALGSKIIQELIEVVKNKKIS